MKVQFARGSSLVLAGCVLLVSGSVKAMPQWVTQIPNGSVNNCSNCHVNPAGGGTRTPFGNTVKSGFINPPGLTGSVVWGPALATIDSDGDGQTNGAELQDPNGSWSVGAPQPGSAALVRNPGIATPAVPALGAAGAGLLALLVAGVGGRSIKRRK